MLKLHIRHRPCKPKDKNMVNDEPLKVVFVYDEYKTQSHFYPRLTYNMIWWIIMKFSIWEKVSQWKLSYEFHFGR